MSLLHEVVMWIEDNGAARADDMAEDFPEHTLQQLAQALVNAKRKGYLRMIEPSAHIAGRVHVQSRAKFAVASFNKAPSVRPVASVWELGARA